MGDVGAMGYGVLRQGMTVCARVAQRVHAKSQRGLRWEVLASPDLTLRRALKVVKDADSAVEVIVLMAGVPDILLATSSDSWSQTLEALVLSSQQTHSEVQIVIAGLPPLQEFRPVPARIYRAITKRVAALNLASSRVAAASCGTYFVPFPPTAPGALKVQGQLSWATLHETWADAIAPAVLAALEARRRS